jgi:hypothetical protein
MVSRFSEGTNDAFALRDFDPANDRFGSCVTSNAGPNGDA